MRRLPADRSILSPVPGWLSATIGRWRRRQGKYDKTTLACFYSAWRKRANFSNLMAYLKFRRDLGFTPPAHLLKPLADSLPRLNPDSQRRIFAWLWEGRAQAPLAVLASDTLSRLAESSPPAAAALAQRVDLLSMEAQALALLQNQQEAWRVEFSEYLTGNRDSICVVGNAAGVANTALGRRIDAQQVVVRFNRFSMAPATAATKENSLTAQRRDVGCCLGVWVCSPDVPVPYPPAVDLVEWVVITGPDVRYHLSNWGNIIALLKQQKKVLTVPLRVWRMLVRELKAPPSAGILCLAWLIEILGAAKELKVAGFQRQSVPNTRYHYALHHHKPSRRHNWEKERLLLCRWEMQGLQFWD